MTVPPTHMGQPLPAGPCSTSWGRVMPADPLVLSICAGIATVMDWLARHPIGSDSTTATLAAVISELRLVHGIDKVTAEGFCWGAQPVLDV